MHSGLRLGLIAAFGLGLAACSATKLVYNKLDWFASWQLGKYVELRGTSEALFESGFASLWQWHRATQLSLYAKDLRELADAATTPLSPVQARDFLQRANGHAERMLIEALPAAAKVIQAMDDEQIAGLLERMAENRAERIEEHAELNAEERRERTAKNLLKNLKRWLGSASPEQKQRAQDWIAARPDHSALWQRYDEQWAAAFVELLAVRSEPDFPARLRGLLLEAKLPDSSAVREAQLRDNEAGTGLMSELSGMLSPEQRAHFQQELRDLGEDLEALRTKTS